MATQRHTVTMHIKHDGTAAPICNSGWICDEDWCTSRRPISNMTVQWSSLFPVRDVPRFLQSFQATSKAVAYILKIRDWFKPTLNLTSLELNNRTKKKKTPIPPGTRNFILIFVHTTYVSTGVECLQR